MYRTVETKNDNIIPEKDPVFKKIDKEPIYFNKIKKREKERKKIKSNSGCLLTLSFFIVIGIIITTSILQLL